MDDANSLYVGGLSYESNEESLREVFREYGEIVTVKIIYDRDSRESRGFGFVTFTNSRAAAAAIRNVDGAQIEGRTVRVNEVGKNLQRAAVGGQLGGETIREEVHGGAPRDLKIRGIAGSGEKALHRVSTSRERSRSTSPAATNGSSLKDYTPQRSGLVGKSNHLRPISLRSRNSNRSSSNSPPSTSYEDIRSRKLKESNSGPIQATSKLRSPYVTITAPRTMTETKGDQIEELQRLKRGVEKAREDRRGLEDKIASLKSVLEKAESAITALRSKSKKLDESLAKALQMASLRQLQLRKLQTGVLRFKLSAERLVSSEKEMKELAAATLITDGPENDSELQVKTTDGDGPKS